MEKNFTIEVAEADAGERLDRFLVARLPGERSRVFIQRLIELGDVLVDDKPVKCHHKIGLGESIAVTIPELVQSPLQAENIPLDIVYEDGHLIVINKPQEMVVHPAPGHRTGTLVNALLGYCKNLSGIGGVMKPGIVHRIDMGTSGLLVVAKDDQTHKALARQFKDKTVTRVYHAVVKGVLELDNGIIELPIGRSSRDRKKMAVDFEEEKISVTRYKVLKRFKDCTMVELTLGTGRTHQIRVHMAYIGHPVVGDEKYGSRARIGRPALHAKTIGFIHPVTKRYLEFTSELPDDMKKLIEEALEAKTKGQGSGGKR